MYKIHYISLLVVCGIFAIIPQINVFGFVNSTITSKYIWFVYGCLALSVLYFISFFIQKIKLQFSKLDIALFLLLVFIFANGYFFQKHFGFSIRFLELLGLSFLYVVLRNLSSTSFYWILLSIVVSGAFQAILGSLQVLGYYESNHSGFKITGSFFNPGPYAGFIVSVWSIALGMYLFVDRIVVKVESHINLKLHFLIKYIFSYLPLIAMICIAVILPATRSRASWIAVLISSIILLEYRYSYFRAFLEKASTYKKRLLIVLTVCLLSLGLFGIYNLKKASSDGRALIWKVTTEMIKDSPFIGYGFDGFKTEYMNYQANFFAENKGSVDTMVADNSSYAFNELLQFVAENGLLGLLILITVVSFIFNLKTKEEYEIDGNIVKVSLLTICVFGCFSYPMQILPIKLVLVFSLAMLSKIDIKTFKIEFRKYAYLQWIFKTIFLVVCTVCITNIFFYTKKLEKGFMVWEKSLNTHKIGFYAESAIEYASIYDIFKNSGDFLMNYGKALAMAGEHEKAVEVLERAKYFLNNTVIETSLGDCFKATKQYQKAEISYLHAADMIPSRFYGYYLLAKLYDETLQKQKAVAMATMILNKKAKIHSTAINEMSREMEKILIKNK